MFIKIELLTLDQKASPTPVFILFNHHFRLLTINNINTMVIQVHTHARWRCPEFGA